LKKGTNKFRVIRTIVKVLMLCLALNQGGLFFNINAEQININFTTEIQVHK